MDASPTLRVRWQNGKHALIYGYIREFVETNKIYSCDNIPTEIIAIIIQLIRVIGLYVQCFKSVDIGTILDTVVNPCGIYAGYQRIAIRTMHNNMLFIGKVWGGAKAFDRFKEIPEISNKGEICLISEGTRTKQTIVVTAHNKIYCIGSNRHGEFGNGKRYDAATQSADSYPEVHDGPRFNVFDSKLVKIHGTSWCTFWLSQTGILYQSGYRKRDVDYKHGQTGKKQSDSDRYLLSPTAVSLFEKYKVDDITSGNSFVLCLCDNGKVFAWGDNSYGQCGVDAQVDDDNPRIKNPTLCELLTGYNIKQIACGDTHSVVIDENGTALLFGNNDCGQIGDGDYDMSGYEKVFVIYPHVLDLKVTQAAAGTTFTLIVTDDNKLYFMGSHFNHPVEPFPKMIQIENGNANNAQIVKIYAWYRYSMVWLEK